MSSSVLPMVSSKSFVVSGLKFRSLIHLEFIFVYGVRKCSNFILLHGVDHFFCHHMLKRLSYPLYIFACFVKDKVSTGMWIYYWTLYFVPLIYIAIFIPVSYCLNDCNFVVQSEVRKIDFSSSILLFQYYFDYLGSFVFLYKL